MNNELEELMLLRITDEDRPGLTASIMAILAKYDVSIQDIGQVAAITASAMRGEIGFKESYLDANAQ